MVSSHKFRTSVVAVTAGWAVALAGYVLPWAISGWDREYGSDLVTTAFELGLGAAWTWLLFLFVLSRRTATPGSVACALAGAAIGIPTFALLFGPVSGQWPSVLALVNGAVVGGTGGLVHAVLQHRASAPRPQAVQRESLLASIAGTICAIAATRVIEQENGLIRLGILVAAALALRFVARFFLARRRSSETG